jgi:uncharacterized paraquat-inducible protein A
VATYTKKNPRDQFIIMREGHHDHTALVCCECGTLVVAGPLAQHRNGCACPRAGCESHYYTEKAPAGENYVVGMMLHHR